jgi:hypothetical protein
MEGGKGAKPGTHTKAALRQKAVDRSAHLQQLAIAVAIVADGAAGPDMAASIVEGVSARQVRYAIAKASTMLSWRPARAILTDIEMKRLVQWVHACEANDNPAREKEVSEQVQKMLQIRRLANRANKNGNSTSIVGLTPAEEHIALKGGELSHTWFQRFYAANPRTRATRCIPPAVTHLLTPSQLAAGQEPIKFPVHYLGDNHGSRFHPEVLKIADPNDPAFIGILLEFEQSNTSQFLQMWDQINKAAHASYNKGKDEYKKHYKSKWA